MKLFFHDRRHTKTHEGEIELLQQRMTHVLFILFPKIKLQNAKFQDKEIEFAE